jgi:hypothetical protein
MHARWISCAALSGMMLLGARAADVKVDLRANAGEIVGTAATADLRGIELRGVRGDSDGAAERLVPWDMVRAVDGSVASAAGADLPTMLEAATELWRARTRVERGDMELARPLFRAQWPRFARAEGPTAALVAEGALRCAVAAGELDAALEPWLECLRHRAAGEATRFPALSPALDPETGLLPVLPPFVPSQRRAALVATFDALATQPATSAAASASAREVGARLARIMQVSSARGDLGAAAAARSDAEPAVRVLALLEPIAAAVDERAMAKALGEFDRAYQEPAPFIASWRLAASACAMARHARLVQGGRRNAALERAALEMLAIPASGLDKTGLVDAYALEEAESLAREAGLGEVASRIAALRGAAQAGGSEVGSKVGSETGSNDQESSGQPPKANP